MRPEGERKAILGGVLFPGGTAFREGIALWLALFVLSSSVYGLAREQTTITGDKLVYNDEERVAQIFGRAKIVRKESTLTSEKLKVFFDEEGELLSAEARGEVEIGFPEEDIRGEGDSVDYLVEEGKVVLRGNPRLWQGENEISGKTITVIIKEDEERVIVDGEVRAVYLFKAEGEE